MREPSAKSLRRSSFELTEGVEDVAGVEAELRCEHGCAESERLHAVEVGALLRRERRQLVVEGRVVAHRRRER